MRSFISEIKLDSIKKSQKETIENFFDWINTALNVFTAKKTSRNQESSGAEDTFRKQIMIEFGNLVNIDSKLTFLLIDEQFDKKHEQFLKTLN